ncbi:Antiseptic resistance protein [Paraconexibacter sp. AEG42_29]|uniref:Antiseptic resistance protein n=1 Tax=Paraconexibacter sp. AEG42_29 TaxID=2997339 RepID=A0AAU7AYS6_9ACTN
MLRASRWTVLAALCLAVFVVNLATTVVNIGLPSLVSELDASTGDLLWIVDAFNLAFAALVLAGGSLSDRFGRRRALLIGLAGFAATSLAGAWSGNPDVLIAWRAATGVFAAVIFPVTLSILTNVFEDRRERATAIGIWGAATGLAVALGPVTGGALVEHFWWGSILVFNGLVAVAALGFAVLVVPDSRDPETPPLDVRGLVLSSAGLGLLVHAIIQAPERGWGSTTSLVAFAAAVVVLFVFVLQERRTEHPMLDVALFKNMRFTAASSAIAFAFFAMFGFIFLVTQYFQFVRGYGPLEAGLRTLPVATSIAIGAVVGTPLAVRLGSKLVVAGGLLSLTVAFTWISLITDHTSYGQIVGQMAFLGIGIGLVSSPATEAIMGVVPAAKAGIGSAVNDATRELGGTLGVAVIGSVALSLYRDHLTSARIPPETAAAARESIGGALEAARRVAESGQADAALKLTTVAKDGYLDGMAAGCLVAAGVALLGALLTIAFLPSHPGTPDATPDPDRPLHPAARHAAA